MRNIFVDRLIRDSDFQFVYHPASSALWHRTGDHFAAVSVWTGRRRTRLPPVEWRSRADRVSALVARGAPACGLTCCRCRCRCRGSAGPATGGIAVAGCAGFPIGPARLRRPSSRTQRFSHSLGRTEASPLRGLPHRRNIIESFPTDGEPSARRFAFWGPLANWKFPLSSPIAPS